MASKMDAGACTGESHGKNGARIIETYPIDIHAKYIEYERYSGLITTYEKEGFKEAFRRSERRPIMRYYV
jgi:hypothetical protein